MGSALFKDDTLEQSVIWPVPQQKFEDKIRTMPDGKKVIDFEILVGVAYKVVGDDKPHVTVRSFNMLNTPIGEELKFGESRLLRETAFQPTLAD